MGEGAQKITGEENGGGSLVRQCVTSVQRQWKEILDGWGNKRLSKRLRYMYAAFTCNITVWARCSCLRAAACVFVEGLSDGGGILGGIRRREIGRIDKQTGKLEPAVVRLRPFGPMNTVPPPGLPK